MLIMDKRQDKNMASTSAETIEPSPGSGSLLCQGFRRKHEETVWKRKRIQTSLAVVMFMLRVMAYVDFYQLFRNLIGAVRFVSQQV